MTVTGGPRFDQPSERTLGNVLRQQALHRPETRFVVADDVSWTFADVDQRADGLARGLVDLGVALGDTVAIYSGNRADLVPLVFAINRLGAVWVPINTDERGSWLRRTLQDSRATVVVVDSAVVGRVAEVMHGLPMAHLVLIGESDAPANLEELPEGVDAAFPRRVGVIEHPTARRRCHLRRHIGRPVDVGHHRTAQGGDAEPQRVDPGRPHRRCLRPDQG